MSTCVGISVAGKHLRIAILKREGTTSQVERALEVSLPGEVDPRRLLDEEERRAWHEELVPRLNGQLPAEAEAVVAIPSAFCRIRVVPVDADLTEDELEQQAQWEVEHAVLGPVDDYSFGVERFVANIGMTDTAVIVTVRSSIVAALRQMLAGHGPRLRSMEAGVFAAQRAFEHNYDVDEVHPTVLLGWEGRSLHGAFIKGGSFLQYVSWIVPDDKADAGPMEVAGFVRESINKAAAAHDIAGSLEDLSAVYIYGDVPGQEILDALRDTCEARVERLNPFQRNRPAAGAIDDVVVETRPESFAVAVGAALW